VRPLPHEVPQKAGLCCLSRAIKEILRTMQQNSLKSAVVDGTNIGVSQNVLVQPKAENCLPR
jgi:hypothetical protein